MVHRSHIDCRCNAELKVKLIKIVYLKGIPKVRDKNSNRTVCSMMWLGVLWWLLCYVPMGWLAMGWFGARRYFIHSAAPLSLLCGDCNMINCKYPLRPDICRAVRVPRAVVFVIYFIYFFIIRGCYVTHFAMKVNLLWFCFFFFALFKRLNNMHEAWVWVCVCASECLCVWNDRRPTNTRLTARAVTVFGSLGSLCVCVR